MKKKLLSMLLCTVMAVSLLAGCGSTPSNSSASAEAETAKKTEAAGSAESDTKTAEAAGGDVEIWYYWETEGHQKALDHIIQEFNSSNEDGITVEAKYVPFADFKKQLSIGASAGELPDLVILDNPDHASYAAMGIFADLTGRFDVSTYYEGPINSCTLDGKLYGVPFGSNCLLLFYNKDMLEAAACEVPATWDELLEVSKACTNGNVSGFAHCGVQNEEGTFNYLLWQWSTGATSYEIDSENGIKALTQVQKMIEPIC